MAPDDRTAHVGVQTRSGSLRFPRHRHMSIIVPRSSRAGTADLTVQSTPLAHIRDAWRALAWLGAVFTLLGFADIGLGWYPAAFGNSEWEFGTISGSLNALTIPVMGLYLMLASAIARGERASGRVLAILLTTIALGLLVLGFIYITVIPVALKAVANNELVAMGMKKAVVKAVLLGIAYVGLVIYAAVRAWRIGAA